MRLQQVVHQSVNELQDGAGLGLDDAFHHDLADRVPHRNRNAFIVMPLAARNIPTF